MQKKEYNCIQGYECLSGCIANYFNHKNININESDIFLIGEGFRISYSGDIRYPEIGTRAYQGAYDFLKRYKLIKNKGTFTDEKYAKECIEKNLVSESVIIMRVRTDKLNHHGVYRTSPPAPHWINVIGMDENTVTISDCAIPSLQREKMTAEMDMAEFMEAWRSSSYEYILLNDKNAINISISEIKKESAKAFFRLSQEYFSGKKSWFSSKKSGALATEALFDDLYDLKNIEPEMLGVIIKEINYQVKLKGIVSHKYVILMKMKEMKMREEIIEQYESIIEKWNELFFKLLRIGMTGKQEKIQELSDCVKQLNTREKEIFLNEIQRKNYI